MLVWFRRLSVDKLRFISTTAAWAKKRDQIPPRPTLADDELHHTSLKGSGPGGQKINKTSSAIQMTHLPTGLVVKSQATRSRTQNYTIARRILAEKVELLQKGDESRVVKKQERASKKKASADKKKRRKYKKLADEQDNSTEDEEDGQAYDAGEEKKLTTQDEHVANPDEKNG